MSHVMNEGNYGEIPDGYRWCEHCNGYGSSLADDNERCARCNGTGLVASDRREQAATAPANGTSGGVTRP